MRPTPRPRLLPVTLACAVITAVSASVAKADATPRVDALNPVLGTQTIGVKYSFTDRTRLVETAQRILDMGSPILKVSLSKRVGEMYALPKRDDIRSLTDLARLEPSVKAVLDMPFAYYHLWTYAFAHADAAWKDGFSEQERKAEYDEIHALACYLLKTYSGTGKTFFLGHWEGDWSLLPDYNPQTDPAPEAIAGMIAWLNARQDAIEDAKREIGVRDVQLYNYTEVNLVQKGLQGGVCLTSAVLPHTRVDYVSYSAYDTINPHTGNTRDALFEALNYIESKLPPKPGLSGKRVFIGEYGFPLSMAKTPEVQDFYSRDVCRAALEWGCPFVLYWELYCNEIADGKHRGFWLIDDKNQKQPFYFTLQRYYAALRSFAKTYQSEHGAPPTDAVLRQQALTLIAPARAAR